MERLLRESNSEDFEFALEVFNITILVFSPAPSFQNEYNNWLLPHNPTPVKSIFFLSSRLQLQENILM